MIGAGPLPAIEGLRTPGTAIYKKMMRLSMFPPHAALQEEDVTTKRHVKSMEVLAETVLVPARETTYWCIIRKLPDLEEKNHIIQVQNVTFFHMRKM